MKTMKKLFLIAVIVITALNSKAQGWTLLTSGTSTDLYSVCTIDNLHAVAVGNSGVIVRTSDCGETWTQPNSNITNVLYCVNFPTSTIGYISGDNGLILKTTNGGIDWTALNSVTSSSLLGIYFITADIGWVVGGLGGSGIIYKTINGGTNWTPQVSGSATGFTSVYFVDANNGWAGGTGNTVYKTTNGGSTWTPFTAQSSGFICSLYFTDTSNGYLACSDGIDKTINGGSSYTEVNTATMVNSICFTNSQTGWAVNQYGTVYSTTNGGTSWATQDPHIGALSGIDFYGSNIGFMVGSTGSIYRYGTMHSVTFTVKNSSNSPINGAEVNFGGLILYTNPSGQCLFSNFPAGTYDYTVARTGYTSYTGSVTEPGNDPVLVILNTAPCVEPMNGNASSITNTSASLSWTAGGGETIWNMEWGPEGFTQGTGTMVSGLGSPSYSLSGLTPGQVYDFDIQADCGTGLSTWAGPFSFTTLASNCNSPSNLQVYSITTNSAVAEWNVGGAETSWNLEWGLQGFTLGTGTQILATGNLPETITGLASATVYDLYVQGNCSGGQSSWVGPTSFTTLSAGTCTSCPSFDYTLSPNSSWQTHSSSIAADGCKTYKVSVVPGYSYTFTTGCDGGATANFDTQLYLFEESACGQVGFDDDACPSYTSQVTWLCNYASPGYLYVQVKGYNSSNGNYTIAYNYTDMTTSIADNIVTEMQDVMVYPNPANDFIEISSEGTISELSILSDLGKEIEIFSVNDAKAQIDLSKLPVGMYLIKINSNDKVFLKKIIKE